MSASAGLPRLIPTGTCWCGCGREAAIGAFFAQGHDKRAEGALLACLFGGQVAQLLQHFGYGPDRSVSDDAVESGAWERCTEPGCGYPGTPESVRRHRLKTVH